MENNKKTATSIWLTKEVQDKLDAYCAKYAANRSEVVRRAIEQFLKENK